jgi:hypothetical protein
MLGVFRSVTAADLLSLGRLDVEMQPDEGRAVLRRVSEFEECGCILLRL